MMIRVKQLTMLFMLFLGSLPGLHAQKKSGAKATASKVKVTWGDKFDMPRRHQSVAFIGNPGEGYSDILMKGMSSMIMKHFDKNLKTAGLGTVNLEDLPRGASSETFITLKNNKIWWIYSSWDRDAHKERLHARKVDNNALTIGEEVTLLESENKLVGGTVSGPWGIPMAYGGGKYNFNFSSDSSKILVNYVVKPEVKRDSKSFEIDGLFVFDENMKKISGFETQMPYTEKMMDNEDYEVDLNGNAYMVAKVYEEERKETKDKETPNYHFEIFRYGINKSNPDIIPFSLDHGFAQSIGLYDDAQGNVYCTGFYSKDFRGSVNGAYVLRLDAGTKSFSKYQKGYYDLPLDVLKSFESERTQKKMDKKEAKGKNVGSNTLEMRRFAINSDGSITIVGEEYFLEVHTTYDSRGMSHTTYTSHYDDIYVLSIDPSGTLNYVKKIPKRQTGGLARGGQSFKFFAKGNDVYLFFLDNAKNANLPNNEAPAAHRDGMGGMLVCVKIDAKGHDNRSVLFDTKEAKQRIFPAEMHAVDGKTLLGTATAKKSRTIFTLGID